MNGARDAFAFLTRLPVGPGPRGSLDLVRAAPWFPLVGLVVGAVSAGVHALAALALPGATATVVALLAAVVLTGGLHEDGLADAADAVGAHTTQERRQEILHDPRVGTFGALALVFSIALLLTALAPLRDRDFFAVVVSAHVLARSVGVLAAYAGGRGSMTGSARVFAQLRFAPTAIAGLSAIVLVLLLNDWRTGVSALATGSGCAAITMAVCRRSLPGINGDVLGATIKMTEVACVVALAAAR